MKRNFSFIQSGNLYGIVCKTKKAKNWCKENLASESWQWMGNVIYIDIRYAEDIVNAIQRHFD